MLKFVHVGNHTNKQNKKRKQRKDKGIDNDKDGRRLERRKEEGKS